MSYNRRQSNDQSCVQETGGGSLGRSRGQTANATRGEGRRRSRGIHTAGVEVRLVADEVSGLGISRLRRKTQDADPYT